MSCCCFLFFKMKCKYFKKYCSFYKENVFDNARIFCWFQLNIYSFVFDFDQIKHCMLPPPWKKHRITNDSLLGPLAKDCFCRSQFQSGSFNSCVLILSSNKILKFCLNLSCVVKSLLRNRKWFMSAAAWRHCTWLFVRMLVITKPFLWGSWQKTSLGRE